jgi:hypothetical protein
MSDQRDHDHNAAPAAPAGPAPAPVGGGGVSALAFLADPSTAEPGGSEARVAGRPGRGRGARAGAGGGAGAGSGRRGVEWVRAGDLLTRGGVRVGSAAVGGQERSARFVRRGMASIRVLPASRRGTARRSAPSLPSPSAFGQGPAGQGPSVPAVSP